MNEIRVAYQGHSELLTLTRDRSNTGQGAWIEPHLWHLERGFREPGTVGRAPETQRMERALASLRSRLVFYWVSTCQVRFWCVCIANVRGLLEAVASERESLFLAADSLRLERFGRAHPVVVPDARAFSP